MMQTQVQQLASRRHWGENASLDRVTLLDFIRAFQELCNLWKALMMEFLVFPRTASGLEVWDCWVGGVSEEGSDVVKRGRESFEVLWLHCILRLCDYKHLLWLLIISATWQLLGRYQSKGLTLSLLPPLFLTLLKYHDMASPCFTSWESEKIQRNIASRFLTVLNTGKVFQAPGLVEH